jgi:hypothetical protein
VGSKVTWWSNQVVKPQITITRYPYEEPYNIDLLIEATNGRVRGQLEIYTNPESLVELADVLEAFPRTIPAEHLWELGSETLDNKFAYYFKFLVFTTDATGHCAFQFRFNNNRELSEREISEFCIITEPAERNRLGRLMREYSKLEFEVLHWELTVGRLYRSRDEFDQAK